LKSVRHLPLVAFLLAAMAAPAAAQIYCWRDASGNLVYSDRGPQGPAPSFKVIGTPFRSTRRAEARYVNRYDDLIEKHAATYAVSPQLLRAVMQVESGFNPRAVSSRGAMGLMQLMPGTAIEMGVRNPFDPDQNIRGGAAYLRLLLNRYAGNEQLALAAYNAGPETVARYGSRVPPYRETRKYLAQVSNRAGSRSTPSSGVGPKSGAPPPSKPATTSARVYKYWEKTADGRLIQKFSDTKPATGPYEIVR
jgi:soluble lytic murein transglycosylase-like protein